jgi:hypothetical protein
MKKLFFTFLPTAFIFALFIFTFLFINLNQIKPAFAQVAPACTLSTGSIAPGGTVTVNSSGGGLFGSIGLVGYYGSPIFSALGNLTAGGSTPITVPSAAPTGRYLVRVGSYAVICTPDLIVSTGGSSGSADIGIIEPGTLPTTGGNPSSFIANLVQASIRLLLIVAFIIDLIWTMLAGLRFITAGGDPKTVGSAWSQIYWGLIGMVVVIGSFAIIKLIETFFQVNIISGGFQLPTI